ncbi:neurogenic differentiation factor 6-B-like [Xenia sp. Carnegie-2017]|uniref:neurogenic differentiation factor 6-B-like n=1 Tax=Xenia sp. Carnegie-2017 TaxID=2897299 RepID=UPI001F036336|nr:neurogenic differentiation factor 6-B-like [Xenia sp. Carnegie-2017]
MNRTPFYGFSNINYGLSFDPSPPNHATFATQRTTDLCNVPSRKLKMAQRLHQPVKQDSFPQQEKRKTTANRSRTLYNKRLLVNARERERMKTLNKGFENLRNALPCYIADGHISKITTLRLAINYIKTLSAVLQDAGSSETQFLLEQQPLLAIQPCSDSSSSWLATDNGKNSDDTAFEAPENNLTSNDLKSNRDICETSL